MLEFMILLFGAVVFVCAVDFEKLRAWIDQEDYENDYNKDCVNHNDTPLKGDIIKNTPSDAA